MFGGVGVHPVLRGLNLIDNQLSGSIPESVGNMKQLGYVTKCCDGGGGGVDVVDGGKCSVQWCVR